MVREQQGLRFDIFRSYTSANDTAGAIKALRKYGPEEPQLYPAALAYFTSDPKILEEAGDELDVVLKKIDEDGLMAPLQVIQTLSTNAVATMGMVKKYLSDTIDRERKEISNVCLASSPPHNQLTELRTVVSSKATVPRPKLSEKRWMTWAIDLLSFRPGGALPVVGAWIYQPCTFYASTRSTKTASMRQMAWRRSVQSVLQRITIFALSEKLRRTRQTGTTCFKMHCSEAEINLGRLASSSVEVS